MKNILLVDDDYDFLKILSYTLKKENINIILAYNVDDGINKINEIKFDLICSDYQMGEKNGLDLLKYLRNNNNSTKFVMLTGYDDYTLEKEVKSRNGIFIKKTTSNLKNTIIKILYLC